jgi:nucleotide-binding universal stress UspA family protein
MNTTPEPVTAAAVSSAKTSHVSATGDTLDLIPQVLHLKSILVPIGFSDASLKALHYAVPFARQFGARLTLLHVVPPPPLIAEGGYVPLSGEETLPAAEERLHKIAESIIGPGFTLRALTRSGFVHDTVLRVASEEKVDLIILNTHGYTGLKHLLVGSTAENILHHAPCPVLIVRDKMHKSD